VNKDKKIEVIQLDQTKPNAAQTAVPPTEQSK
jgi:hypothetical protein